MRELTPRPESLLVLALLAAAVLCCGCRDAGSVTMREIRCEKEVTRLERHTSHLKRVIEDKEFVIARLSASNIQLKKEIMELVASIDRGQAVAFIEDTPPILNVPVVDNTKRQRYEHIVNPDGSTVTRWPALSPIRPDK